MRIENINQKCFRGYDVMPLRGFYMQGISRRGHKIIFDEMKAITKKEGLNLYFNSDNIELRPFFSQLTQGISWWGQDCLAFIKKNKTSNILWNSKKIDAPNGSIKPLEDLKILAAENYPRGGNYYLGYNEKGERWLLINSMELKEEDTIFSDKPSLKEISDIFEVKPENILVLDLFNDDLDEVIRPIKYPYILVNDWEEALKNAKEMYEMHSRSQYLFSPIEEYIKKKTTGMIEPKTEHICKALKEFGFIPIKIAGRYHYDINYMNALAWENNSGNISYLTNSVKDSYKELEFLEKRFEESLKERVSNIDNLYFVSGGPRTREEKDSDSYSNLMSPGFYCDNVIMDMLAVNLGGIHCLTAEIPEELFDK